ncbi:MAG: nuclear transport factor 2 family protein [Candidatus Binataceae bacterium]
MSNVNDLVDRYIAIWNETDAGRRRDLVARTWTETASYLDPMMQGEGPTAIDAMIQAVQQRFPGHRFRLVGNVDSYQDRVRFCWELAPEGGPALVKGSDFGLIANGKLATITGFLDQVPAQS